MKTLHVFVVMLTAMCTGCENNPAAAPVNDAEWERQNERYQQQLDIGDEQIDRVDKIYEKSEEQGERMDTLLQRWERQADRYDKILDRWEKQGPPQGSP